MQSESERSPSWLAVVVGIALVLAVWPWPPWYYTLMRWGACIAGCLVAYRAYQEGALPRAGLFGLIAVCFNPFLDPLLPFTISRIAWEILDPIVGAVFLIDAFGMPGRKKSSEE